MGQDHAEDMHTTHTQSFTHKQASVEADQEEKGFQGHEKEAWMEKGILSHVATFISRHGRLVLASHAFGVRPMKSH